MGIMDFSDLYYMGGQSLVTVKDNAEKYNSFEAINKPDVSVGAQVGSIQMDLANENSPEADIVGLPKVTDIISELLTGKMDAAYIETDVAKEDGSLEKFIADAGELAAGEKYEGLLDAEGNVQN